MRTTIKHEIEQMCRSMPDAKTQEIFEALKASGVRTTASYVRTVRSDLGAADKIAELVKSLETKPDSKEINWQKVSMILELIVLVLIAYQISAH